MNFDKVATFLRNAVFTRSIIFRFRDKTAEMQLTEDGKVNVVAKELTVNGASLAGGGPHTHPISDIKKPYDNHMVFSS